MSASSASVGARLVTILRSASSTAALSRACTRKPPATDFKVTPAARGSGRPPATQQAQVLLRREDLDRLVVGLRRDHHLGEDLGDLARPPRRAGG